MNEGELLFTETLGCTRTHLYLNGKKPLAKDKALLISSVFRRRLCGEPIDYILGRTEFMGLEFRVDKNVLIPRPETEILVETAINIVHSSKLKVDNILDIGTGSGCIAISLAKFVENINVTASDVSDKALEIARNNASLNNVRINFLQSDLFSNHGLRTADYGLIISNPPYIPGAQIHELAAEISYEPAIALDGGEDGLDFYRRIINEAPARMRDGGFLIMEMGFNQCENIKKIFSLYPELEIIEVVRDYSNIERVIVAKKFK